jgi:hypothetical protein
MQVGSNRGLTERFVKVPTLSFSGNSIAFSIFIQSYGARRLSQIFTTGTLKNDAKQYRSTAFVLNTGSHWMLHDQDKLHNETLNYLRT